MLRKVSDRITPAYAGKRVQVERHHCHPQDHPRVCGEKHVLLHVVFLPGGSPPRMRGKD